ncbi:MAG: tRNA lysidine(34) synthetase TilS [Clostridiales bacterium]|nr:tRNA lysidine(34) synthetase TilS [Clostridiales bacterium]
MLNQMEKTIKEHNLITKKDKIIVAVSGGPDSIAMLYGLILLKEKYQIEIFGVHLNHMIRGVLADKDERYVLEICKKWDIPIYTFREDIPKMSKEMKMTEEEIGRKVRYEIFEKVCKEVGCDKIAVAQNKNDQVETFLMRMLRGAGMDGLSSIQYIRDKKIIRPLLGCSRESIEDFCESNRLEARIDHTNLETEYLRNKIRINLIPHLIETYNPNLLDTIYRNVEIIQKDADYMEIESQRAFEKIEKGNRRIDEIKELHPAIRLRVLRKLVEKNIGSLKDVSSGQIEELERLIMKSERGKKTIIKKFTFIIENACLDVFKEEKSKNEEFNFKLHLGENVVSFADNYSYKVTLEIIEGNKIEKSDNYVTFVDYDSLQGGILVRNRMSGDKFKPIGLQGRSKKLKEFFIDKKISKEQRNQVMIFQDSQEIIWVGGYRLSETYKVKKETSKMLKITLEKL